MSIECPYSAKVLETVSKDGCWNQLRMGIYLGDQLIGEYLRNYSSFGEATFHPFQQDGQWYALYSKDYTATRLMKLPECIDIGGEDPQSNGFCPVEYHIPQLCGHTLNPDDPKPVVANHDSEKWAYKVPSEGGGTRYYWPDDKDHPYPDEERKVAYLAEKERSHATADAWSDRHPFTTEYARWGFVAGCYWGDDSSWKVQFLDLSRAKEGIITRDERFGYIWLPRGVSLKDAIDTESIYVLNDPPEKMRISIALPVRFRLDGQMIENDFGLGQL